MIIESTRPCTGELLCDILDRFNGAICVTPPSLLEQISLMGEGTIQVLSSTHMVLFAGAPLQEPVGNVLASHGVKIISAFGTLVSSANHRSRCFLISEYSTETGQLTVADVSSDDPLDWPYVRFIDPFEITLVDVPNTSDLRRLVVKVCLFENLTWLNSTILYSQVVLSLPTSSIITILLASAPETCGESIQQEKASPIIFLAQVTFTNISV